ncbi:hypothetical protein [Nocardioides panaciterrulae]|uniref:Uncharacterized protein n=1 Tax=Nocardioides panaciterrulae TaxID=661492 RepID=A0A7Y9E6W8_9ACTN|nr:hypothetical protein [Nocardioides panaciterrulae]NYD42239.1 hypothetical protein [Nocardioides panaciterrulae]
MSPLVLLGSLGTLLSTVAIVPHLLLAVRMRKPSGSPFAWSLGAVCSAVWFAYGLVDGDFLVAAPGLVTIPVGLLLAAWSHREQEAPAALPAMVVLPPWEPPLDVVRAGDTIEMPRVVA